MTPVAQVGAGGAALLQAPFGNKGRGVVGGFALWKDARLRSPCENFDFSLHRLERLELRFCGRPFGDEAAAALAAAAPLDGLKTLVLGGAYRLTDGALGRVLRAAPHLTELRLPQGNKLMGEALEQLPQLVPHLE